MRGGILLLFSKRDRGGGLCTNYRAPDEGDLFAFSNLKIDLGQLWAHTPWKPMVWPDYEVVENLPAGEDTEAVLGTYGFRPKFVQPERCCAEQQEKAL